MREAFWKKRDLIHIQEKSIMPLDKVVIRPEQVFNSKVCTSKTEGNNINSIEKDKLLKLELSFMPTEANTPCINILDRTLSNLATFSQSTKKFPVQWVSKRGNKGKHPRQWIFIANYLVDSTQSNKEFKSQTFE